MRADLTHSVHPQGRRAGGRGINTAQEEGWEVPRVTKEAIEEKFRTGKARKAGSE